MIDRSYLPFQSARDYQDPGMQKWMGFFLSEHTSSLSAEKNRVDLQTFYPKDLQIPSAISMAMCQNAILGGHNVAKLQKSTIQAGESTTGSQVTV